MIIGRFPMAHLLLSGLGPRPGAAWRLWGRDGPGMMETQRKEAPWARA
nr:MAG TPA: hypothetical protein [Bacteriophage sp.]